MQDDEVSADRLLTRKEAAAYFALGLRFLEVAAVRGDGPPFIKINRSVRYRVGDIRDWIEARRVRSTSDVVAD